MAVIVTGGLVSLLRSEEGLRAQLHVVCAQDGGRVLGALRAAVPDLAGLAPDDCPAVVMGPYPVPGGCLLMLDYEAVTPPGARTQIPGILVRRLEEAGITEAEIGPARQIGRRYGLLESFAPVAKAWLASPRPQPGRGVFPVVAPVLVDAGMEWITSLLSPGMDLGAVIISAEIEVSPEMLREVLDGLRGSHVLMSAVATDFTLFSGSIAYGQFLGSGVALAAAGAGWPAADVAARMRAQREIIRARADDEEVEWAAVTARASNRGMLLPAPVREYRMVGPAWYQLLSPEQLRRIGGPPPGAVELPGGRTELTIGEPEQWVPGHPGCDAVQQQARRLLAPLYDNGAAPAPPRPGRLSRLVRRSRG